MTLPDDIAAMPTQVLVPPAPPARQEAVIVRALTGEEERRALHTPGTQRALTALIAECVHRPGSDHPLGTDAARALISGERTRLGLTLGAVSCGGPVRVHLRCTDPGCRAPIALDIDIDSLAERPPSSAAGTVRCPIPSDMSRPVRGYATFRLPDGADQEAVEALSTGSRHFGVGGQSVRVRLLDRLLLTLSDESIPSETALWDEADREAAWLLIRGKLGGVETEIDVACRVCGNAFIHRLGALGWLRSAARETEASLEEEIALLMERYGWSEEQVLWLPRPKRQAWARLARR